MPNYRLIISEFVAGDDKTLRFTVDNVPTTNVVAKAYLTVKADVDDSDPGLVQKAITTTPVSGTGQIEDTGSGDGTAILRFELTPTDTDAIGVTRRVFDVQIILAGGELNTPFVGTIYGEVQEVTEATT